MSFSIIQFFYCVFLLILSGNSQASCASGGQRVDQLSADLIQSKQLIGQLSADLKRSRMQNEELKKEIMKQKWSKFTGKEVPSIKSHSDYTWNLKSALAERKHAEFELLSDVFRLQHYPYGAQVKLTMRHNRLSVSLAYKNSNGNALQFNVDPSVRFRFVRHHASDVIRHHTSPSEPFLTYDTFYYEKEVLMAPHEALEIKVEGPLEVEQALSLTGSLTWVIDHYRKRRRMEEEGLVEHQESPYFRSQGYRVQAHFRLSGSEGMAMRVHFASGAYGKGLNVPFPHALTFTLLHPTDHTKHVIKHVHANVIVNKATWYSFEISTQQEIERLIENDTLYYRIEIVPQ